MSRTPWLGGDEIAAADLRYSDEEQRYGDAAKLENANLTGQVSLGAGEPPYPEFVGMNPTERLGHMVDKHGYRADNVRNQGIYLAGLHQWDHISFPAPAHTHE